MKHWLFRMVLLGLLCFSAVGLLPVPASANNHTAEQVNLVPPAPPVTVPVDGDFSDADFTRADQAELGALAGGDGVGLVLFILLVVLLVLLILWFLNSGSSHHARISVHNDRVH